MTAPAIMEKAWPLNESQPPVYQLLHLMEETAAAHTVEMGIPRPLMLERYGAVWMIVRAWVQMDRELDLSAPLTVRTWHRGVTAGVVFRDFDLLQRGETIGQAVQTWVLVDVERRTLFRMSRVPELVNSPVPAQVKDLRPRKLAPPRPLSQAEPLCAPAEAVDVNGHINNAAYVPLLLDALPRPIRAVRTLEINYHHECFAGQQLPRQLWQEGSEAYVRLLTPEGVIALDLQVEGF